MVVQQVVIKVVIMLAVIMHVEPIVSTHVREDVIVRVQEHVSVHVMALVRQHAWEVVQAVTICRNTFMLFFHPL